ncbi:porin [Planktotalea sp.]|uniref:porin n=1 Tax=Planktotalea sp. TaxID=2029877 RepID=UPI003D6B72B0
MKKVLFATTALIATAGVAAADVSFGGYGRFGAQYTDPAGAAKGTTAAVSRFRLQVDASAESDNGLSFSARVRFQADNGGVMSTNAPVFRVGAGGLTVTVGNIVGAIDAMPGNYPLGTKSAGLGLQGLGWNSVAANTVTHGIFTFDNYSSAGAGTAPNGVTLAYAAGDFGVTASYSSNGAGAAKVERSAISASYTFSGWTVALGYQDSNNNAHDMTILTVGGNVGIADVGFQVAQVGSGAATTVTKYQINAGFDVGAATRVYGYVNSENNGVGEGYGLGVSHDLGGGASIEGGIASIATLGKNSTTVADLGLHFNF